MNIIKPTFAFLASLLFVFSASAQNIGVSPQRLEMPPNARAASVKLTNNGDTAKTLQIRVFAWRIGDDGKSMTDESADSADIVPGKPVITILPGAVANVRFVSKAFPRATNTAASFYRIAIKDITPEPVNETKAEEGTAAAPKVTFTIRQMLPLVVLNGPAAGKLSLENGVLKNIGNKQVRVESISKNKMLVYLLPNESNQLCPAGAKEKCVAPTSLDEVVWTDSTY